jgi:hypothetical protein
MTAAFVVGIKTAGDFAPVVGSTKADANVTAGDMNGNDQLDIDDVQIALEIANGYRTPSPSELAADPNKDFNITVDDAMAILDQLKKTLADPKVDL